MLDDEVSNFLVLLGHSGFGIEDQDNNVASGNGILGALDAEMLDGIGNAARFPQTLAAQVAGVPATVDTVAGALELAVRTQLATQPGADIKVLKIDPTQVAYGSARTFLVEVRVEVVDWGFLRFP